MTMIPDFVVRFANVKSSNRFGVGECADNPR